MSRAQVSNLRPPCRSARRAGSCARPASARGKCGSCCVREVGSVRGRAVSRVLAHTSDWLPEEPDIVAFPFHYWRQLPQILLAYSRGESVEAIGQRAAASAPPGASSTVSRWPAAALPARLNRDPASYGLD